MKRAIPPKSGRATIPSVLPDEVNPHSKQSERIVFEAALEQVVIDAQEHGDRDRVRARCLFEAEHNRAHASGALSVPAGVRIDFPNRPSQVQRHQDHRDRAPGPAGSPCRG